ncbi:MAG: hypothetical protein GY847_00595 [Proteobacteria bacterium]|nr:hypothetical protein [Pseudomonadota bacterium]
MILHGPRLLLSPGRSWNAAIGSSPRRAMWLIAAAVTAAVWPAVAVVVGHIGSAVLGHQEATVATLRAAIGFISVLGSALVMAPALTLVLLWSANTAHEYTTPTQTGPVAMGILWPTWTVGLILAVPPLFGQGPELGEIIWAMLAALVAARTFRLCAVPALAIRRRWRWRFITHSTAAFVLVFVLISIGPAIVVRAMLDAATPIEPTMPDRPALPLPPEPNW